MNIVLEQFGELFVTVHQVLLIVHYLAVAPVAVLQPEVALHRVANASVLAEHIHKLALHGVHCRLRIVMAVLDVSAESEVAAGGRVDQSGRVLLTGEIDHLAGVELAPALVERHPYDYALEALQRIDYFRPLLVIIVFPLLRHVAVGAAHKAVA